MEETNQDRMPINNQLLDDQIITLCTYKDSRNYQKPQNFSQNGRGEELEKLADEKEAIKGKLKVLMPRVVELRERRNEFNIRRQSLIESPRHVLFLFKTKEIQNKISSLRSRIDEMKENLTELREENKGVLEEIEEIEKDQKIINDLITAEEEKEEELFVALESVSKKEFKIMEEDKEYLGRKRGL